MQLFQQSVLEKQSTIIKRRATINFFDQDARKRGICACLNIVSGIDVQTGVIDALLRVFDRPNVFVDSIRALAKDDDRLSIHVLGSIDERVVIVRQDNGGAYCITFGNYDLNESFTTPQIIRSRITRLEDQVYWYEDGNLLLNLVSSPSVYIAALYHPENFPVPRFSLAVSDLIRVARQEWAANVHVADMQLGTSIDDIVEDVRRLNPALLGISATFGQQDILEQLLQRLEQYDLARTKLVFGGSLSALNKTLLLERFPQGLIATGPGENTMRGLIRHLRGEIDLAKVEGLAYVSPAGDVVETPRTSPRDTVDMLPELDLLLPTLERKGAIQLESSRGCSYACSFCPRTHKGVWAGDDPHSLHLILEDIKRVKSYFPQLPSRVFLVDEEFFGYRPNGESEKRVAEVSELLNAHGFSFETSSRIDQIFRPHKDLEWHTQRLSLWRHLVKNKLERCLFGVESGVDSILGRFNKKTTARQNAIGIRLISLLDIPPRYTYITFDPLMNRDELIATYTFLGRKDLLLSSRVATHSDSEIFEIASDDDAAVDNSSGKPFYEMVSYLLVSMECLIGAPYTKVAEVRGLLGPINPKMGRFEVHYEEPDIGIFSRASQAWIDRNFSLDYLFKGMNKYISYEYRPIIQSMRVLVKKFAYDLLGLMIGLWNPDDRRLGLPNELRKNLRFHAESFAIADTSSKKEIIHALMDTHFGNFVTAMRGQLDKVRGSLSADDMLQIENEFMRWSGRTGWSLINGLAENC